MLHDTPRSVKRRSATVRPTSGSTRTVEGPGRRDGTINATVWNALSNGRSPRHVTINR